MIGVTVPVLARNEARNIVGGLGVVRRVDAHLHCHARASIDPLTRRSHASRSAACGAVHTAESVS